MSRPASRAFPGWLLSCAAALSAYLLVSWSLQLMASLGYDWIVFQDAARALRGGGRVYPGNTPGLPFLYPPYLLPWIGPLAACSRAVGYSAFVALQFAGVAVAVPLLALALGLQRKAALEFLLLVVSTASWQISLQVGHLSPFFLMVTVFGLALVTSRRSGLAGLVLSCAMLKPNLGLVFPLWFLIRRDRRGLAGWTAGFALLALASLPLGTALWGQYLETTRTIPGLLASSIPGWKQQTLFAFWRWVSPGDERIACGLWLASVLPLCSWAICAWTRTRHDPRAIARTFAIAVLLLVCCTPYLFLYDAIVLAVPAAVWWADHGCYSRAASRSIAGSILFIYFWQHLAAWIVKGGPPLVGPVVAVWLVAELVDLRDLGATRASSIGLLNAADRRPVAMRVRAR